MKHIFTFFLIFFTNITGMITTEFLSKTNDELFSIMIKFQKQNQFHENDFPFLRKCINNGTTEIVELINHRQNINNNNFLSCQQYLHFYKACIARMLPYEMCEYIDVIYAQLTNNKWKENFKKTTRGPWNNGCYNEKQPNLTISNNGHYAAHTIPKCPELITIEVTNTTQQIHSGHRAPLYFSPNNKHYIVRDTHYTYFSDLSNHKIFHLIDKIYTPCFSITISNDSQHILLEGRDTIQQSKPSYLLWTLDASGTPQKTKLKNNLFHSMSVIFHSDNNHIIHNQYGDELRLYNIATTEDREISKQKNINVLCLDKLTIASDNKTILATTCPKEIDAQPDYILFNIENLNEVTAITLPQQSYHEDMQLPVLSIPHKQMLTHITNEGKTLQLIDHNAQLIATHSTTDNIYITALTVDTTGTYLAVGHSNGTILIWNIFSSNPAHYKKTFITSNGSITSLTLTENQLLLSQSRIQESTAILGNATLWDIYGNKIMNFGDNVNQSIISPNGKTVNIACVTFEQSIFSKYVSTLITYYLTDKTLSLLNNKPNLAQLSRLINEEHQKITNPTNHSGQKLLDAQQPTCLPYSQ